MTLRELLALSDEELHALTPEDILGTSDRRRSPRDRTLPPVPAARPARRHLRLVRDEPTGGGRAR